LNLLRKGIRKLSLGVSVVGMFFLIPMMLMTSVDVVGRALWARPLPGVVELSSYMLAIFILLGVAFTQQAKGHVRVSMLLDRLPERARLVVNVVTTLFSLFIMALLAWQGWVVGMEEKAVSDMLRIPQMPFKLLVAVAGSLLCLELLVDLFEALKALQRRS